MDLMIRSSCCRTSSPGAKSAHPLGVTKLGSVLRVTWHRPVLERVDVLANFSATATMHELLYGGGRTPDYFGHSILGLAGDYFVAEFRREEAQNFIRCNGSILLEPLLLESVLLEPVLLESYCLNQYCLLVTASHGWPNISSIPRYAAASTKPANKWVCWFIENSFMHFSIEKINPAFQNFRNLTKSLFNRKSCGTSPDF